MAPDDPPPRPARDPEHGHARPAPDPWWKIRLFSGMANDLRRRLPYYLSDWRDAWDYRVVPATVYMYFAKYVVSRDVFLLTFHFLRVASCLAGLLSHPPPPLSREQTAISCCPITLAQSHLEPMPRPHRLPAFAGPSS